MLGKRCVNGENRVKAMAGNPKKEGKEEELYYGGNRGCFFCHRLQNCHRGKI